MRKVIERFDAMSEDGHRVMLVRWQNVIDTRAEDGTRTHGVEPDSLATADGDAVNLIDDDTFEIVRTAMIVKRIQS